MRWLISFCGRSILALLSRVGGADLSVNIRLFAGILLGCLAVLTSIIMFRNDGIVNKTEIAILQQEKSDKVAVNSDAGLQVTQQKIASVTKQIEPARMVVKVRDGDSLSKIFKRQGLPNKQVTAILSADKSKSLKSLRIGSEFTFILDSTTRELKEFSYQVSPMDALYAKMLGGSWQITTKHIEPEAKLAYVSANIDSSIYLSAKKAGVPNSVVKRFVSEFSTQVDYSKLRGSDTFTILYKDYTVDGKKTKTSELVAAELVHKGIYHRIIAYKDRRGDSDFYTADGHSTRPMFVRYPLAKVERIGSRFSMNRKHPILGVVRPHLGVDFPAKAGTPVQATSDGKVEFVGTKGGYGRTVIIKNGIYSTLYAHLLRYSGKVKSGQWVKQGEVIGYVGSSGISTSAHLHYEFRVKGVRQDPLKVKLPGGKMIDKAEREKFFALSRRMVAQLELYRKDNSKILAMVP